MRLNLLQPKTPIVIYTGDAQYPEIHAEFMENESDTVFTVRNQDMYDNIDSYYDKTYDFEILNQDKRYTARCRVIGISRVKRIYDTVRVEVVSEFIEQSRRACNRHDVKIKTSIYKYTDDKSKFHKGELVCDALSSDVSVDGMCLMLSHEICAPQEAMFTLEFSVRPNSAFSYYALPATIIKTIKRESTRSYDYIFKFDFSNMPDAKNRILDDILSLKLV